MPKWFSYDNQGSLVNLDQATDVILKDKQIVICFAFADSEDVLSQTVATYPTMDAAKAAYSRLWEALKPDVALEPR